MIIAYIIF